MSRIWAPIGKQLKHPQGIAGRLTGGAMTIVNAKPNRLAVAALDIQAGNKILELGFGSGAAIPLMLPCLGDGVIYGLEQSGIMLEQARSRNRRAIIQGRVRLQKGDFSALTYPDACFNKILAVNTVYFWHDDNIVQECLRVLRPGGRLVVYATDEETMRHWKFADRSTHRHFTASTLDRFLRDGGFAQCHVYKLTISKFPDVRGLIACAEKSASV